MKFMLPCDMCKARGKLWLSGDDYLECPQCFGKKQIEIEQHRIQARVRTVYIPSQKPFEVVDLPQRSLISDSLIRRE